MPQMLNIISHAEFMTRLRNAVDYYETYCKIIGAASNKERPVDWLDHFQEYLDVEALEKRKNSS